MEKLTQDKLPKNAVNLISALVKYIESADEKANKKESSKNAEQKRRI
jgi:hypothetical protein